VSWDGDQSGDTGVIYVGNNRVEAVSNTITNAGPSWNRQLPEPKVMNLIRAGRGVVSHWASSDLAAEVRQLAAVLAEFADIPDEG
jgi:hypothetical protein